MTQPKDLNNIYDICIIGAGPAGIIVALEFATMNPSKTVILIEYGEAKQKNTNQLDDSITIVNPTNHHPPSECTNKGFGGTSRTWGGRCVMYDEIDFIPRPVLNEGCTWNINLFEEIQRFLPRSAYYFECGQAVFSLSHLPESNDLRIAEHFKEGAITDSVIERWSMPTRFGTRYKTEIERASNITLLEGYEGRDFSISSGGKISSLKVRKVKSKELKEIKAGIFVLSAGTQEVTRILLRNKQLFGVLGNTPFALGKYYQGHLSGKIASVTFTGDPKKTDFGFLKDIDGTFIRRRFQFTTNFLKEQNLLNTAIWLDNPLYYDPKHRSGAMSFMYLAMITPILGKKLAPAAIANSITKGKVYQIKKHIVNIIRDFPRSILTPISIFYQRYLKKRKLPGVFLFSPSNTYALHFHSEQTPHEENRMELADDGETLIIHYSLTKKDIDSVIELHEVLDQFLQENNIGKLSYWYEKEELPNAISEMSRDGIHQSGTTRIADSFEKGVVDKDLKVFGTTNLFICSSSVFPISGQANPTFMEGAFAIRLANHIKRIYENS